MASILGISLKVKHLGLAVLTDGELIEFRVRTFYGVWTPEKRRDILRTIRKMDERHEVSAIVVKTPKPTHCSRRILNLMRGIEKFAKDHGIKLTLCTITELTKQYSGKERCTKQTLIQAILQKYPHHKKLAELYAKERSNRNSYHVKIFEAIACAELAQRTEQ